VAVAGKYPKSEAQWEENPKSEFRNPKQIQNGKIQNKNP